MVKLDENNERMEEITLNLVEWSLSIQGTSSKVCGIALDVLSAKRIPI